MNRDQSFNKNRLITSGFPRSGNVFLNYSFKCLYYPDKEVSPQTHVTNTFKENTHVITPIRNPLDCISSWNLYQENFNYPRDLNKDITYYLRFYSYVLNNLTNILLLDFNVFKTDLDYITNKVFNFVNINPVKKVSLEVVKDTMIKDNKVDNLPRNNQLFLTEIKNTLQEIPQITECLNLYLELKEMEKK